MIRRICGYKNDQPVYEGQRILVDWSFPSNKMNEICYAYYSEKWTNDLQGEITFRVPDYNYNPDDCHLLEPKRIKILPEKSPYEDEDYKDLWI